MMNCAVTHGPLPAGGGGNVQPATVYSVGSVMIGCPPTFTRGLGTVGCAWPACAHSTVAPMCRRKPGMSDHLERAAVDGHLRTRHLDRSSHAVVDLDAGRIHHDLLSPGGLQRDAADARGVVEDDAVA